MRYRVAYICMDEDGHYSVDVPQEELGWAGLESVSMGTELDGNLSILKSYLDRAHPWLMELIKRRQTPGLKDP